MRTREQAQALLQTVLGRVTADEARVSFWASTRLATRFADNAITQNTGVEEEGLRLTVACGPRHGSAVTNRLDDASLAGLVRAAEEIARQAPEDPEYMPVLGPQVYPAVPPRCFADAAALTPADLAAGVSHATELARREGYIASGLATAGASASAQATSRGLTAWDESTHASFSVTFHGPAGGASASASGEAAAAVDPRAVAQEALATAKAAQNPRSVTPGDYTVIMEPEAGAELLAFVLWNLDARRAAEGSTALAGQLGQPVASDRVTISTEIDRPDLPAPPSGLDGLPVRRTVWVQDGALRRLRHDRFWAQQRGTEPDPALWPVFMRGGEASTADLVAGCRRGLLVKHLWYIRYVDHKELLLTGMTRDGLFLIEDGRVVGPVKNLRFNESPLVLLRNAVALGRPKRVDDMMVPAIRSEGFTFSSTTESV